MCLGIAHGTGPSQSACRLVRPVNTGSPEQRGSVGTARSSAASLGRSLYAAQMDGLELPRTLLLLQSIEQYYICF